MYARIGKKINLKLLKLTKTAEAVVILLPKSLRSMSN